MYNILNLVLINLICRWIDYEQSCSLYRQNNWPNVKCIRYKYIYIYILVRWVPTTLENRTILIIYYTLITIATWSNIIYLL